MMSLRDSMPCLSQAMKSFPDGVAFAGAGMVAGLVGAKWVTAVGAAVDGDGGSALADDVLVVTASDASSTDSRSETGSAIPAGESATPGGGEVAGMPAEAGGAASSPGRASSVVTVPANGAGRSPDSQIKAGDRRRKVKLWDQPVPLVTVARQITNRTGAGCTMPWSWSTVKTAVLFDGMPSMPCDRRCARSLSLTVLLTSQSASWVSHPSDGPPGWFSLNSSRSR